MSEANRQAFRYIKFFFHDPQNQVRLNKAYFKGKSGSPGMLIITRAGKSLCGGGLIPCG